MTELLRIGARKLITDAVEVELQHFLSQYASFRNEQGHQQVVRKGYLPEREIQTGIGPVTVRVPKIRDKSGQGIKFNSTLLPPYLRKTRRMEEVLPWLHRDAIKIICLSSYHRQPVLRPRPKSPRLYACPCHY